MGESNEKALQGGVKHVRWDEIPRETMNPLFDRQLVVGSQIMVARIIMKKGCEVPTHSHQNEQISHIQSGSMRFTIEGKEITLKAGEFLCIPPHLPHSAVALEDMVGIDIFTPPRQDWIDKTDQYLRR
ncbi:MAG: cupin domain-containing protein [Acidobacteriaceae bacterium]|nr:cupin domain-containing protein [Acidobacteriaceae bacterium]MBV9499732.1 cupin domain-containing protein [Acidobacteriaceae bacterium]